MKRVPCLVQTTLMAIVMTCANPVRADELVLASNARNIAAGRVLADGEAIRLRRGQRITLLREDGSVHVLDRRQVYRVPAAAAKDSDFLAAFVAMFAVRKKERRLGGVRGGEDDACALHEASPASIRIAALWNAGCKVEALDALKALEATLG